MTSVCTVHINIHTCVVTCSICLCIYGLQGHPMIVVH